MGQMKYNKGYLFIIDALIALSIIILVVLLLVPIKPESDFEMNIQEDSLLALSSIKISEINNSYAHQLIADGKIIQPDQSALEQIGEFYAREMPEAGLLASSLLEDIAPNENIGIWFDNQLIASSNSSPYESAEKIWTARQIVSGIEKNSTVKGFSSRAFFTTPDKIQFYYFGGYIGDGNISVRLDYIGNIKAVEMEIAVNNNFSVYINGNFSGNYTRSASEYTPNNYSLPISNFISNLTNGNIIDIKGKNLYIAGGYIKIVYESSEPEENQNLKYLPGIKGLVNIYDSFYVPSTLNGMDIFLHYNSSYELFMTIGNSTVYNATSNGAELRVNLTNSTLYTLLNYTQLSNSNIPLKVGLKNSTYNLTILGATDSALITDVSGSMSDCSEYAVPYICNYTCNGGPKSCVVANPSLCTGNPCGGTCKNPRNHELNCNRTKLDFAKSADKEFFGIVLNYSVNRVGTVSYSDNTNNVRDLTTNATLLNQTVDSYVSSGTTCICCGINNATNILKNSTKIKTMLLMSDGAANVVCAAQGTGNAKQDAIKAACDAYNNYNITINAVGFNASSSSDFDEATLISIANCSHGNYSRTNATNILEIYRRYAEDILRASYYEQTVSTTGSLLTTLFSDSYIALNYSKNNVPFGRIFTIESPIFGNMQEGNFTLPSDSEILDARAVSYSGIKWTKYLEVYNSTSSAWQTVFNLSVYGGDYTKLGDSYFVNIPLGNIVKGLNRARVKIGGSPYDTVINSTYDKLIYSIVRPSPGYSSISISANGCIWTIIFEDLTNITLKVPANYTGTQQCDYATATYNQNDAIDNAVYNLLSNLDLNLNGRVETKFSEQDLQLSSTEITGIPFPYETEVQIRVWR